MTLTETFEQNSPRTFAQTLAALLRHVSDRLDGGPTAAPELADLKALQRYHAEVALLNAEAEEERHRFTVGMLRERVKRLSA